MEYLFFLWPPKTWYKKGTSKHSVLYSIITDFTYLLLLRLDSEVPTHYVVESVEPRKRGSVALSWQAEEHINFTPKSFTYIIVVS